MLKKILFYLRMSNIFATFAAAKDRMCLSSKTKSGAKVQQKNEKYK